MSESLYLIDGHAQIYRAYYARFGELTSPAGEPTRATHVFFQMLLNIVRDRHPTYLAMVMDTSDETVFRKDFYPEYKANREPPPEDLPVQTDRIVSILQAARIPILRMSGFEADDILATLTHALRERDLDIFLVSKDKDLEQLVSERVSLFDPGKNEIVTAQRMFETKGWTPAQAIESQILTGDTVDNVPGVPGIGPKTAAKLLQKFGSARGVLDHADELTPKQRENVLAFGPSLEMVRKLVTLRRDVPIEFDLAEMACERFTWSAAAPIFTALGFRRLTDQLPGDCAAPAQPVKSDSNTPRGETPPPSTEIADSVAAAAELCEPDGGKYVLVNSPEALEELAASLSTLDAFALDTETTSLNAIDAELVGLSFSWEVGSGFYVPTMTVYGEPLPLELVREKLGPILAGEGALKVGQNLKYDLLVLSQNGFTVNGPLFDTMVAAFVSCPEFGSYGLDKLAARLFDHAMIPISELIGKGRDQLRMDQVPLGPLAEYAAEDTDYTWRLYRHLEPMLKGTEQERLFYETEMPLVTVLTRMELNGVRLDASVLEAMSGELAARVAEIVDEVHTLVGETFNLDSPKQLATVLFDKLKFRVVKKTRTSRSTDAETLGVLFKETKHAALALLLEYREIQKLRGTYVDALPKARSKRTRRIHTSYHQIGAITGRLSSSDPNLQNIPVRTEQGRRVRKAFVPREDADVLIVADYSQVELRVLAHFCEDEALIDAFQNNRDIHAFVAAQVNGVAEEEVTSEMRSRAKAVNFGIIYGQSAFGLAQATGMSRGDAQAFINDYFARYPRVRGFLDKITAAARDSGCVHTILGRRRPIRDINSRNRTARAQAERFAVNTVMQGSAADLIKIAMVRLHRRIIVEGLPLRMLLQVHDELVCEAPRERAEELAAVLAEEMSGAMELRVPLEVDVGVGDNWLEAK